MTPESLSIEAGAKSLLLVNGSEIIFRYSK
jgi:hypothetical protein